jgi:sialidase-1
MIQNLKALATLSALSLTLVFFVGNTSLADDQSTKTDVFVSGTGGYHSYRIPAVILTPKGTLLAFCEGRKSSRSDHGDLDLVLRRSTDNGRTWTPTQTVYEEGGDAKITIGNPCPVVDQETGRIWLPFCRNNDKVLVTYSDDNGKTWAKPTEITDSVKEPGWGWYATGPGVGIQLTRGKHKGRLVIPCDHSQQIDGKRVMFSHAFYSDDHGKTWKLGGTVGRHTDECQVVELNDGTLMMNMRNYWGRDGKQQDKDKMRAVALSRDGGTSWGKLRFDKTLIEPICQGSFLRYATKGDTGPDRLLFSNPASKAKRERLTVRLSRDDGKTWPVARLLHKGPSAYSCLTVLSDGSIGCLYEGGEKNAYEKIIFARCSLKSLRRETSADKAVVKEIKGFKPPRATRLPGFRRTKPAVIENQNTLTKVFGDKEAEKISKQVDLDEQVLVFFQWAGSGQDKLAYTVQKQDGKTIVVFTFRAGRTRDLRPHAHLFSIRKGVSWRVAK